MSIKYNNSMYTVKPPETFIEEMSSEDIFNSEIEEHIYEEESILAFDMQERLEVFELIKYESKRI